MAHSIKILLCLGLLLASTLTLQCNASHFDLVGIYTLGKQDELNRTFQLIQKKMQPLANVTFNLSESVTYTLYDFNTTFYYRDSQQKAQILGNDTIVVSGGRLEADVTFSWRKNYPIARNGTGSAFGLSSPIIFAKQIIIENDTSYSYQLFDYGNVTWHAPEGGQVFNIRRIDPADASEDDIKTISRMLNDIMKVQTFRLLLEAEIDRLYAYYLRFALHDEHHPVEGQFDYVWVPGNGKPNSTISMHRKPLSIDIETDGIRGTFDIQAEKASNWTCGTRYVPDHPLNVNVYGHTQQFISYDFYQNMIRHAISKNLLDTGLDRQNWESSMFQFFAGDLYEILPGLQGKYQASKPIDGNCKATYSGLKIWKAGDDTFNVSIHFDCQLSVAREKIIDFAVGLQLQIAGHPNVDTLDFRLRRHEEFSTFYQYGQYKIQNIKLAELMVKHSLNRLYHGKLFGSGWPLSPPKDYPHFLTDINHTLVYDTTHVNQQQSQISDDILALYD